MTVNPAAVLGEKSEGDEKEEVRGGGFEKVKPAAEGTREPDSEASIAEEARLEVSGTASCSELSSGFLVQLEFVFGAAGGGREGGRKVKDCRRRGVVAVEEAEFRVNDSPPVVGVPPSTWNRTSGLLACSGLGEGEGERHLDSSEDKRSESRGWNTRWGCSSCCEMLSLATTSSNSVWSSARSGEGLCLGTCFDGFPSNLSAFLILEPIPPCF